MTLRHGSWSVPSLFRAQNGSLAHARLRTTASELLFFFFLLPLPSIIDTRYHPLHFRVLTSSLSNQPISIEPLFSIGFTPLGITFRDHKILRGPKNVLCLMNKQKKVYRTPPVQSLSSLSSSSPYLCHSRANAYPVDLQLTRISRPVESRTRNGCI